MVRLEVSSASFDQLDLDETVLAELLAEAVQVVGKTPAGKSGPGGEQAWQVQGCESGMEEVMSKCGGGEIGNGSSEGYEVGELRHLRWITIGSLN